MKAYLVPIALLLSLSASAADTIPFKAGKWKFDTSVSTPMMQQPIKHTQTDCVLDNELSVQKFIQQSGNTCQINHLTAKEHELQFGVSCIVQGSKMSGTGHLYTLNDRMSGSMNVQMTMQGLPMQVRTSWIGTRVGECR